ncbi:MAG: hypothetical protein ACOCZ2_03060 [Thermodesulfobacteriota bacterium]
MISLRNLDPRQLTYFIFDVLMLLILLANLSWIIFDWIYSITAVQTFLANNFSGFQNFYTPFHQHFFYYDLFFVAIFVTEILIRWGISIYKQTYHRWFFYPFVHWYDTLGCIPIGTLRFLRIIRIVSIFYRLQRLHIIDLTNTYIYRKIYKYMDALTEEITDRVIVKMIDGVQEHLTEESQVINQINQDVIRARKPQLTAWLSTGLQKAAQENYPVYKDEIRNYINTRIKEAVSKNREMSTLGYVPVLGQRINRNIERIVSDIVFNVFNDAMQDVNSDKLNHFIDEITDMIFEAVMKEDMDNDLNRALSDTLIQSLEIVKNQVLIQQWKYKHQ